MLCTCYQVGGTYAIWIANAEPLGVQTSQFTMILEATRYPLHDGITYVNDRGIVDCR